MAKKNKYKIKYKSFKFKVKAKDLKSAELKAVSKLFKNPEIDLISKKDLKIKGKK